MGTPEQTERLAELRRRVYARPDGSTDLEAARDELERLESQLAEARRAAGTRAASAPPRGGAAQPGVRAASPALGGTPAPAGWPSRLRPMGPALRAGAGVLALIAVALAPGAVGPAPRRSAPAPASDLGTTRPPDIPDEYSDVRMKGAVDEWVLYAARDPDDAFCLIAARRSDIVGTTCVPADVFADRGVGVILLPVESEDPRPVRIIWNPDGALEVRR